MGGEDYRANQDLMVEGLDWQAKALEFYSENKRMTGRKKNMTGRRAIAEES